MSEAIIGLIGALVGALLSLLGSWLTNATSIKQLTLQLEHSERSEKARSRRERLEELYVLIGHWSNLLSSDFLYLSLVMKNEIDYNSYLDEINNRGVKHDLARLGMIVDIYGFDLKTEFAALLSMADEWRAVTQAFKKAYQSGEDGRRFLKPSMEVQLKIESSVAEFRSKVASVVRSL